MILQFQKEINVICILLKKELIKFLSFHLD